MGKAAEHVLACAPEFLKSGFAEDLLASWESREVDIIGGPQRALIETGLFGDLLWSACAAEPCLRASWITSRAED